MCEVNKLVWDPISKHYNWGREHFNFIRANINKMTDKELGEALGCSAVNIKYRIRIYDLKRSKERRSEIGRLNSGWNKVNRKPYHRAPYQKTYSRILEERGYKKYLKMKIYYYTDKTDRDLLLEETLAKVYTFLPISYFKGNLLQGASDKAAI